MRMHIDFGPQPGWKPETWYQRTGLADAEPKWEERDAEPETCGTCGGETEPGYGLGGPCGGFSVYRFCMICQHFSAVMPLGEEE